LGRSKGNQYPVQENQDWPIYQGEFSHDLLRLIMHAIDLRQQSSYGRDEVPFPYQPPAGYDVTWPTTGEKLNHRPVLGYSKFY